MLTAPEASRVTVRTRSGPTRQSTVRRIVCTTTKRSSAVTAWGQPSKTRLRTSEPSAADRTVTAARRWPDSAVVTSREPSSLSSAQRDSKPTKIVRTVPSGSTRTMRARRCSPTRLFVHVAAIHAAPDAPRTSPSVPGSSMRRSPSTKTPSSRWGTAMSAPRASACGCRSTVGAAARAAGRPIAALTASAARALASRGRSAARRTVVARGMVVTPGKDVVSPGRRRRGRRGCLRPLGNLVRGRHGPTPIVAPMTGRLLRMSTLFVRTLRDDPNDAEVPSHRLLVRAGYIRRAAPGIYTWLPLGLRVLRKIEDVIRDEMDEIGAQELSFPALLPKEPYEASGRWADYGPNIFRLQDRKGADYLLGPTHEEMFTLLVKDLYSSYKDLPLSIYQIQTKYRDEARPRAGLLRGREFVMKDSYSFDIDDAGLEESYQKHRDAYIRIFDRLGFEYVIVKATSGAMGGSASEEFLAKAAVGEDTYVRCTHCDYAANVEAVAVPAPPAVSYDDAPAAHAEDTPDTPTIDTLVAHPTGAHPRDARPWAAGDTPKTVMAVLKHPDGTREPLAIGVPGDRDVDQKRLEGQLEPIEVEPMDEAELARHPALVKGYIGPEALGEESKSGIRFLVDPRVVEGTRWVTGANVHGSHVLDLVVGRDFTPDGTIEAADVRDGDPCPNCDEGTLESARGVEMGHIFQLGRSYAEARGLKVLDENGKLVTVTMGSYGIGPSRAVAAIAEGTLDDIGLCWPRNVAPADVHVVAAGKDEAIFSAAEVLAQDLKAAGVEVLLDDRAGKVSPGVKFKDAELIGVPTIVTVGRGLADGNVEVRDRRTGERKDVPVASAVARITEIVRS